MKKILVIICLSMFVTVLMADNVEDIKVSATVEAVSAYVYKGATWNDGMVFQPSCEVTTGPITMGIWGNYDVANYNKTLQENETSEVDFYVSYDMSIKDVDISGGYSVFTYPHYDYETEQEISLKFTLSKVTVNPFITVKHGLDGWIAGDIYCEAGLSYNIKVENMTMPLKGLVAYSASNNGEDGFSHYELQTGKSVTFKGMDVGASVTYLGLIDDKVLPRSDEGGGFDVDVVGKFYISKSF